MHDFCRCALRTRPRTARCHFRPQQRNIADARGGNTVPPHAVRRLFCYCKSTHLEEQVRPSAQDIAPHGCCRPPTSLTRAAPGPSCPQRFCTATTSPRTAPSYLQFISLHLLLNFYWRRLWPPPPHRSPAPFPACPHKRSRARSPGLHRGFMWYPAASLRSCDMRLDTLPSQRLLSRCVAL